MKNKLWLIPAVLFILTAVFCWLAFFDLADAVFGAAAVLDSSKRQETIGSMSKLQLSAGKAETAAPTTPAVPGKDSVTADYPKYGDRIGSITISSANISAGVFNGDDDSLMNDGVVRSLASAMPGEGGAVVLSAHRTTFFSTLGKVKPGDSVVFDTYYGKYTYKAQKSFIFDMDDTEKITGETADELVLYTCYPFDYIGHAKQRYAVICVPDGGKAVEWR